jgi:ATP-dependent Clp protease protease subunit
MKCLATPVDTVCVGMAASMAAVILAGGEKRYILPHAEVMIHQPSGGAAGMASDILIAADHIRERKQVLNEILSECTGKTVEELQMDTERDRWMKPEEARDYGIVDEVITWKKRTEPKNRKS